MAHECTENARDRTDAVHDELDRPEAVGRGVYEHFGDSEDGQRRHGAEAYEPDRRCNQIPSDRAGHQETQDRREAYVLDGCTHDSRDGRRRQLRASAQKHRCRYRKDAEKRREPKRPEVTKWG